MNTFESFNDLSIPVPLAEALEKMQFLKPTPVQLAAIPPALDGKDILGTAQTGTGKTAAFGIPILTRLYNTPNKQALVLAPTRELAAQIHMVFRKMSKQLNFNSALVVGGESFSRQASELRQGANYIIATPGRLNDHLYQRTVNLSHVGFLVLDEVDRMLDMGFAPQIREIMKHVPKQRQTLFFSATLPREIIGLASSFLKDPVRISIGAVTEPVSQVAENTMHTTEQGKTTLLLTELKTRNGRCLIFTRTKSRADRLTRILHREGFDVVSLHGGRSQSQRKQALERFRSGTHRLMVATDLAGRGIDVNDIAHIINYDPPSSREDYIHRIGRSGRLGKSGNALNLLVTGDHEGAQVFSGAKPAARVIYRSPRRRR